MLIHVTIIDHSKVYAEIVDEYDYDCYTTDTLAMMRYLRKRVEALEANYSVIEISREVYDTLAFYPPGFKKGEKKEMRSPDFARSNVEQFTRSLNNGGDPEPFNHNRYCPFAKGTGNCTCMTERSTTVPYYGPGSL